MTLIPLEHYTALYYNFLLFLIVLVCLKTLIRGVGNNKNYNSFLLFFIVFLYMGLRPISGAYFGDMSTYNRVFEYYASGGMIRTSKDFFWEVFVKFSSTIMTAKYFFLICSLLYIIPLYIACKRWFNNKMYIPFLMLLASFSFWAYGTNGIRNGIATSLIVLAFSFLNVKKKYMYLFLILAFFVHSSTIIPIAAYLITLVYKKPKHFLLGWLLCIPLSLILGSFWENLFASIGFDDRVSYLTQGNINQDNFAYTGFRWDFLLYSSSAVYAGYHFIIKKKFKDKTYIILFNIYVTANAFWILVIRANFSNRFAYLSWFMMAIIIFYPFLKQQFFKNQSIVLAKVMILYFGFTYLMFLIK